MYRTRREGLPPIPHRREDIILTDYYKLTLNKEEFLQHQENSFIIFSTDQNLRALSTSDTVYMDGTFKSAPHNFTQLYTIHATYRGGHVIPISTAYCLTRPATHIDRGPKMETLPYPRDFMRPKWLDRVWSGDIKSGVCKMKCSALRIYATLSAKR